MLSSLPPFSFLPQLPRQRISRVLARPRRHDLPVAVATPDHAAVWRHRDDVELMMPAWFLHAPPLPPLPALVRVFLVGLGTDVVAYSGSRAAVLAFMPPAR